MAVQLVQLNATARGELGSRANKRLRDSGLVPGVLYGHKKAVVPLSLNKRELVHQLALGAHVFDLMLEGETQKVLVKDVQYDHLGADVIHIDFARVSLDERVTVTVPIELRGEPKGEQDGGVLQQVLAEIEVECRVLEIPEVIRHNVAEMGLDDVVHVKDLQLPPGVVAKQDPEAIVAQVKEIKEVVAPVAAEVPEGAAEPELIRRPATEEEGEGEEKK